ncbi:MAG TPA: serine hydrolase domain-containing protein [Pedococcus sp.]|nr:serine hydrolase domain-containing protein [Pedococcus sp.]
MSAVRVEGEVAAGFEKVADVFRENFEDRGDTGAACAVYVEGSRVVDIWAGTTAGGPWHPYTRNCLFSVSKGITTICVLMAVERGAIDLDAPVTSYWPEFGAQGKEATTVRQLLAHQAGLTAPAVDLTLDDLQAWDPAVRALAEQAPAWKPGTSFAYHAVTFGWLAGEVLRRATGKRPRDWLAEHVAGPLGVAMSFGVDIDDPSFAPMLDPLPITDPEAAAAEAAALQDPLVVRAMSLGGALDPANLFASAQRREVMACELPGVNLVSNARSCAKVYAATVGEVDGVRLLGPDVVLDAREVRSEGPPYAGPNVGLRWGSGFMLSSVRRPMLGEGSFGHDGAGGHLAFGHLEAQVGFGYQTVRPGGVPDDRADELCRALQACL